MKRYTYRVVQIGDRYQAQYFDRLMYLPTLLLLLLIPLLWGFLRKEVFTGWWIISDNKRLEDAEQNMKNEIASNSKKTKVISVAK